MKHKDLKGRVRYLNISKKRIDWDAPSRSKFQKSVKDFLFPYWKFDTCFEEMPLVGTKMTLDLVNYSRKIAVEVQGAQHSKFIPYFHGNINGWGRQIDRDNKKELWCSINEYQLVTIYPDELEKLSRNWFFEKFGIYL